MADLAQRIEDLIEPVAGLRRRGSGRVILELDLTAGVADEPPGSPVAHLLARRRQLFTDVVEGLRRGARDPGVAALLAKVDGAAPGFGRSQEIRDAVAAFRAAGKPAIAWSESIGDFGPGTPGYYLASAFSEIALAPTGTVGLTGLASRAYFLRDAAEKLGLEPEAAARYEYKTAVNMFTERGYTDAHRESAEALLDALWTQVRAGIAADRGLTAEQIDALAERAPLLAREALDGGLVDRLAYRDEVYADLRARVGDSSEPRLQYVSRYNRAKAASAARPGPGRRDRIALISAHGPIHGGHSRRSPLTGTGSTGSETVAGAFRAVRRDSSVRAVVFRVDSPGGSHSASDAIRREVELTAKSGTPVVVSMGDVAASGGYYVSMAAGTVVAHPATITGSIGVYIARTSTGALLDRIGVGVGRIDSAPNAGMFDGTRTFTESEWERIGALLDAVYADFTGKVGAARGLSDDEVDARARGRVWSGSDALRLGLIDRLGGLETAVQAARDAAGAGALPLEPFPRLSPLERLRPPESSDDRSAAPQGFAEQALDVPRGAVADLAGRLGIATEGVLTLPGDWRVG